MLIYKKITSYTWLARLWSTQTHITWYIGEDEVQWIFQDTINKWLFLFVLRHEVENIADQQKIFIVSPKTDLLRVNADHEKWHDPPVNLDEKQFKTGIE